MVDNRSAGFYGVGGSFNFKSGDPSGSAAKMSQDKYGSEAMYMAFENEEDMEQYNNEPFVDRSALLRATLNSLAMTNVASVLNAQKHKKTLPKKKSDTIIEDKEDLPEDNKVLNLEEENQEDL